MHVSAVHLNNTDQNLTLFEVSGIQNYVFKYLKIYFALRYWSTPHYLICLYRLNAATSSNNQYGGECHENCDICGRNKCLYSLRVRKPKQDTTWGASS